MSEPALYVERHAPQSPLRDAGGVANLPIVMLHGWGMNLRVFDLLRAELSAHETWAIDLPGHGRSPWWPEAADFEVQKAAVLAALPPRCVLVGWSFGAKLAISIAATRPQRVAALVLLAASPKHLQSPDWPHGMEPQALRAFRTVLEQDWQRTLDDFIALQLRGSRNAEEAQRVIGAALASQGAPRLEALQAGLDLLGTVDLRSEAASIRQPTLIVAGSNDRVTPPGAARWLAEQIPGSRLLGLPRAGHAPFVSHAAETGAAVRSFLAQLPPERAA
jgi:pimeloyl-[acyl-carrier protein] methyl ester esterase